LHGPIRQLLALAEPPTAFVACEDFLAAGALRTIRSLKKCVPGDISLIAFDDTLITQQTEPPLTSVRQNNSEIGARVAAVLIQAIEETDRPVVHELLRPTLVIRGSTAERPQ